MSPPETPEEAAYELGWLGPSDGYGGIAQESDGIMSDEKQGETLEQWAARVAPTLNSEGWNMAERVAGDTHAIGAGSIVLVLGMPGDYPLDEGARALLAVRGQELPAEEVLS